LRLDKSKLKLMAFVCNESKEALRKHKKLEALHYIEHGEKQNVPKIASVRGRKVWYSLGKRRTPHFVFPSLIGERYLVPPNAGVMTDKRFYDITLRKGFTGEQKRILFAAIINSTLARLLIDLQGEEMIGDITGIDIKVYAVEEVLIPKLDLFSKQDAKKLKRILNALAKRPIGRLQDEVKQPDRKALDTLVMSRLGLTQKQIRQVVEGACELIEERLSKTELIEQRQKARVKRDTEKILGEVIEDVLPDGAPSFPEAFWPKGFDTRKVNAFKEVNLTGKHLRLGHAMLTQQEVVSEDGQVIVCSSHPEAEFLVYAARPDVYVVRAPKDKFVLEKTVTAYQRYLANLEKQFLHKFAERTLDHAEAEALTRRAMQTLSPFASIRG
jgi:hypothetical protein